MNTPTFIYGTAWKEAQTAGCVKQALAAGFRAIDTANQRKHYLEAAVGEALAASGVPRDEVFLQTKFTYLAGQDDRLPYDPRAELGEQVEQSFESSLEHLGVETIDAYLLHGPMRMGGWSDADREVWEAMEALHAKGGVGALGVSNVSLEQLRLCHTEAKVKPAWVQNRCFARTGWDQGVRAFCEVHGIRYQGFSLLTANLREIQSPPVQAIAAIHEATLAQVVFAFARQVGMVPLTGTTDPEHMKEDLGAEALVLTPDELAILESVGLPR